MSKERNRPEAGQVEKDQHPDRSINIPCSSDSRNTDGDSNKLFSKLEIAIAKVPEHVEAMCGQLLESGELAHREDLMKSLGKCSNRGTYIVSNGGKFKLYACGQHLDKAEKRILEIEERDRRSDLFSLLTGETEIIQLDNELDRPSFNPHLIEGY